VAGSCEEGDEATGSGATELVSYETCKIIVLSVSVCWPSGTQDRFHCI
jgi:hypothetical protein